MQSSREREKERGHSLHKVSNFSLPTKIDGVCRAQSKNSEIQKKGMGRGRAGREMVKENASQTL